MIPVQPQPEPEDFSELVRKPGAIFLKKVPYPKTKQWKDYWCKVLPHMRKAYKRICAYSAEWISSGPGRDSIDHFVPKALRPHLAYEWSNFRYASLKFNCRKGTHTTILDPFQLEPDWFVLEIPSLLLKPNPNLPPDQKAAVDNTINVLKLNGEDCIEGRQNWIEAFCAGKFIFAFLKERAPFVAYELERQGLAERERIASIMRFNRQRRVFTRGIRTLHAAEPYPLN
jgi:hypothetical protein